MFPCYAECAIHNGNAQERSCSMERVIGNVIPAIVTKLAHRDLQCLVIP